MIQFNCPKCNSPFKVSDEAAGKRGKCNKCGNFVVVPQLPQQTQATDTASPTSPGYFAPWSPTPPVQPSAAPPVATPLPVAPNVGSPFASATPVASRATSLAKEQAENKLGIWGFVISVLSLFFSCGLFSPIGLLVSILACSKSPRGVAIAGSVIGGIGSIWLFTAGLSLILTFFSLQKSAVEIGKSAEGIVGGVEKFTTKTGDYLENPDKIADDAKRVMDKTKKNLDDALGK
jgi:hypothetical protein